MADKVYTVELNQENLQKIIKRYSEISKTLTSMEFKYFLLDKCKKARDEVMLERDIAHIEDVNDTANQEKVDAYTSGNKEEISGNVITLYNDSIIDIGSTHTFFSEEYRDAFYPSELSLAELVEYGAGLVGADSSLDTGDEWEYMANAGRDYSEGWYYKSDNGIPELTQGSEGKYIYYYLTKAIEDNIEDWVDEFLSKKMGSVL